MTREEAKDKMLTESVQYKNGLRTVALRKINNFIDKIFDKHEAQLKLASDVYSTDKMHMYQELKAKDKEIERLKEAMQEFVSRVEKGEVRSSYTYSKFKELLKDNQ